MGKPRLDFSFYRLLQQLAHGKAMKAGTSEELDKVIDPPTLDRLIEDDQKLRKSLDKL